MKDKGAARPRGRPKTSELSRKEQLREAARRARQRRKGRGLKSLSVAVAGDSLDRFREHASDQGLSQAEAMEQILSKHLDQDADHEQARPPLTVRHIPVQVDPHAYDDEDEVSFFYWAFAKMKEQVPLEVFDRLRVEALTEIIKRKRLKKMDDLSSDLINAVVMALIEDEMRKQGIKMTKSS